jgi:hypothetical protein
MPQPNGYNDFLQAGTMLNPNQPNPGDLSNEQLRSWVADNAAALAVARVGLQRQCRVPLGYTINYITNRAELASWKRVAHAFVAEGKLAEREKRPADAARSYLDALHFGHECCRGGVIIDMLVGVACESLACHALRALVDALPAAECRKAAQQLEALDAAAEPRSAFLTQERTWSRRVFGWRGQLAAIVMRRSLELSRQQAAGKFDQQRRSERALMLDLATRAYELEHGAPPPSSNDLVPGYLKSLPRDLPDPH